MRSNWLTSSSHTLPSLNGGSTLCATSSSQSKLYNVRVTTLYPCSSRHKRVKNSVSRGRSLFTLFLLLLPFPLLSTRPPVDKHRHSRRANVTSCTTHLTSCTTHYTMTVYNASRNRVYTGLGKTHRQHEKAFVVNLWFYCC